MDNQDTKQAIALAGVFQAASLVQKLATTGLLPQDSFEASIKSILNTDPSSTSDVFGGVEGVRLGLNALYHTLSRDSDRHQADILRYALSILHLEGRLQKQPRMLTAIGQRLPQAQAQAEHFSPTHENVIANLAGIYQDTLSTFKFRIQVHGDPRILQVSSNADKVRALLLAGVRAAILWRQVGGRRWKLIFTRRRVLNAIEALR